MSNKQNLTVFLDNVGRTIIGTDVSSQEDTNVIKLKNPALVHVQPNTQTNQLQLQILPLFFREFQQDKDSCTVWSFSKSNITLADSFAFAEQFYNQYEQMFKPLPSAPEASSSEEVVKLFDDEEKK